MKVVELFPPAPSTRNDEPTRVATRNDEPTRVAPIAGPPRRVTVRGMPRPNLEPERDDAASKSPTQSCVVRKRDRCGGAGRYHVREPENGTTEIVLRQSHRVSPASERARRSRFAR